MKRSPYEMNSIIISSPGRTDDWRTKGEHDRPVDLLRVLPTYERILGEYSIQVVDDRI